MKLFMALHLVCQFFIHPDLNLSLPSPYLDSRPVRTYWDDVLEKFRVFVQYGPPELPLSTETFSGPTIQLTNGRGRYLSLQDYKYEYCAGTTLNKLSLDNRVTNPRINTLLVWPYAKREVFNNHFTCNIHTCNILFDVSFTTVTPDSGASDGSVLVKATTNATSIRFTRDSSIDYTGATPSIAGEYTFTNLSTGTYSIYAIDEFNCRAILTVFIPSSEVTYSTRWQLDYRDNLGMRTVVDIEERDYVGAVTNVKGANIPFVITWNGLAEVDIFTQLIGSIATITLISESDFMFLDIFTQDDRKFRVKQYKDTGSGLQLKWVGFVLPMAYSEPYVSAQNYNVEITASDQLSTLKDKEFQDDSGNFYSESISFIDAILACLRKTNITLPVYESINIFETTMQMDPEDSSIKQAFLDPGVYLKKNCEEVLCSILKNFGARLYQASGCWNIELIEHRCSSSVPVRVFDIYGQYQSNHSDAPVTILSKATESSRSVLRDRSGLITVIPAYGKILCTLITNSTANLLRKGNFEPSDIMNNQILGWAFDVTNGAGVIYGIEDINKPTDENTGALFVDFTNVNDTREIIVIAEQFDMPALNGPYLQLKFNVLFRPYYTEIFSFIDVSLKVGDYWAEQSYTGITTDSDRLIDGEYTRFYIDSALEWKTIEMKMYTSRRQYNTELAGPVVLKIRINNNPQYDYASITALRAQPTNFSTDAYLRLSAHRVKVKDNDVLRLYSFNNGSASDDYPNIIIPDDYASDNGFWKLEKSLEIPEENYLLAGVLIDNVVLTIDGKEYPKEVVIEKPLDEKIAEIKDLEILHSDLVPSELSDLLVDDELDVRVYKSYIRLNNSLPTKLWKRTYEDESRALLDILLRMYQAQISKPLFKLSGSFFSDLSLSMANSFFEARLGKYFIANSLSIQDKSCSFDAELIELNTGASGEPPTPDTYEFTDEHTTEFDS